MFCYQCEQTAKGTGCTVNGVCGKKADTAILQDALTGELIGLAGSGGRSEKIVRMIIDGLFTTLTNVSFEDDAVIRQTEAVRKENAKLDSLPFDMNKLWNADEDIRSLKSLLLFGLRGMAAYAHHARVLGKKDDTVDDFFYKGLAAVGNNASADELFQLLMELGSVNLRCMEILDEANTSSYGDPVPVRVPCSVEPGPFIVISGHDLNDLRLLLEQTEGKGVNVYTHSEMLPAHGYPELKRFKHLKGNFGTAWQNQQFEFDGIPAPVLFTTNCLMPPKPSYSDRVFTRSVVSYPGMTHIGDDDLTAVIDKAIELGGYKEKREMTGINGGDAVTTGFARATILSAAGKVVEAVRSGAIRHFFLVGGCDGANRGRSYYTEFVRKAPEDTIILTLACGKFRFNDMDIGEIGGLPRIMDMGQCNDAYGAIKVASALAEAFSCSVNDLPLTMVLSWYEQKAVSILLTLLSLGVKGIYIGPSLPAFISPNVLNVLVEKFGLTPISSPEEDLRKILNVP
ncbi:MAG: hydroxylamine reductase [Methanomassiliicoccaceae archaeon]|nr:hydroxylamine reductase [Methanomassiliicoccaceae archaeon]